ncbi:sigma-54 interaction domain-containing protein [Desulfotalea psychrophila]|uniref:Probable sigma-54-dependent transcriptional regulator n=1 Tax=Desulfotalea psychrophila (strain LSv54 / DSM 12343) TaxID=177439 RepID=Q6AR18_DESPS|nr:sigma 54-interacting transcriptional regulator [Desulfotalea psychrophila]CAG35206.1 probable sigma-54-dependent transcriptional regulator [Desulfotalea psychrophila LSv54]
MPQSKVVSDQMLPEKNELIRAFQADGTITFVNAACADFYEKTVDEMIGSNLATFLSEDEREDIIADIFSITPENAEVTTRPKFICKDGRIQYLEYINRGLFRADGSIVEYQSVGVILAAEEGETNVSASLSGGGREGAVNVVDGLGQYGLGFFSAQMQEVVRHAEMYHTDRSIPVLIEGETGVGKEIIAKIIHFGRSKSLLPFVDINCTAISPSLFESELFGYDSGAFTGAVSRGKQGKLDCAHGGTLFLDEIAEIPTELQAKLLRVLEEKTFYRVGGLRHIPTDIRVIAATNIDFDSHVADGSFRKDLYYRLKVGHIYIPALRERREDILPLARMLLRQSSQKRHKKFHNISEAACQLLLQHPWPGNVRELKNLMEWATFMFDAPLLLPEHIAHRLTVLGDGQENLRPPSPPVHAPLLRKKRVSKEEVESAIKQCGGNKTQAAHTLGISIRTLYNRLASSMQAPGTDHANTTGYHR